MEITENSVYEALGLEAPAEPPAAVETPVDAPAVEAGTAAAAGPPVEAAPQEDTGAEAAPAEPPVPAEPPKEPAAPPPEPSAGTDEAVRRAEERYRAERSRMQAEHRRQIEAVIRAERERAAGLFQAAKLKNTFTGKDITTVEEFEAWKSDYEARQLEQAMEGGKLTPALLQQAIAGHPDVRQARELVQGWQDAQRRASQEAEQARLDAAKVRMDAEFAEISKLDPAVKGLGDALKAPWGKAFYDYVKKGNSFLDAFYLSNRERLTASAAEAARQQALTQQRGKEHLTATKVQGDGAPAVPSEEMALFKELNPTATEAEIRAYYGRHRGAGK